MKYYVQATCYIVNVSEDDIVRTSLTNVGPGAGNEFDIEDLT